MADPKDCDVIRRQSTTGLQAIRKRLESRINYTQGRILEIDRELATRLNLPPDTTPVPDPKPPTKPDNPGGTK